MKTHLAPVVSAAARAFAAPTTTMKRTLVLVALGLTQVACGGSGRPAIPASTSAFAPAELTLVWVGRGEAKRLEDGVWKRVPAFDYDFSVTQRRYADHWESIKELHRRHPDYDGSAGPRDQTYFFRVQFQSPAGASTVEAVVASTLGAGRLGTDREFRAARLELRADVSSLAPFDTYRIEQRYAYEEGRLEERVSLLKHEGSAEKPWVENEEVALLFAPRRYEAAPTRR